MSKEIIPVQRIAQSIRWIRGQKVLLDSDLAALYGVTTGNLNKAVNAMHSAFRLISCSGSAPRRCKT
jgi:hypothetical protein